MELRTVDIVVNQPVCEHQFKRYFPDLLNIGLTFFH